MGRYRLGITKLAQPNATFVWCHTPTKRATAGAGIKALYRKKNWIIGLWWHCCPQLFCDTRPSRTHIASMLLLCHSLNGWHLSVICSRLGNRRSWLFVHSGDHTKPYWSQYTFHLLQGNLCRCYLDVTTHFLHILHRLTLPLPLWVISRGSQWSFLSTS